MRWSVSQSAITGRRHTQLDQPRQDYMKVPIHRGNVFAAVADGAGSAVRAVSGARLTVDIVVSVLEKNMDAILSGSIEDIEIAHLIIDPVRFNLKTRAEKNGFCFEDYASTMMLFVSDGVRYFCANLGDGVIGVQKEDGTTTTLLSQERGRYAHQTYLVTGPQPAEHLRMARGNIDIGDVFFLMTDGSADCLFNPAQNSFTKALDTFCRWARQYPYMQVEAAVEQKMKDLFLKATDDDCALLLIAAQANPQSERAFER